MTRRQINTIREEEARGGRLEDIWVQSARPYLEPQHGMIPCTLNPRDFTERLLLAVNIATAYREDIDRWSDERKASGTILNLSSPDDPIIITYLEERNASNIISNEWSLHLKI
jgi:hypothetical protein